MKTEFEIKMTVGGMYRFLMYHAYHSFAGVFSIVAGLALIGFYIWNGGGLETSNLWNLVFGVLFLLYEPLTLHSQAAKHVKLNFVYKHPLHYTLSEEGIAVRQAKLQGLGLDIRILDENNEEIDLNEDLEDEDNTSYGKAYNEKYESDDRAFENAGYEITDAAEAGGVTGADDMFSGDEDDEYDDEDADFDDGLDDEDEDEFGEPKDPEDFDEDEFGDEEDN